MKTVLSVREVACNKATRRQFISDLAHLIDERITAASGLRGALVKRAYAVMKSVRHEAGGKCLGPHAVCL